MKTKWRVTHRDNNTLFNSDLVPSNEEGRMGGEVGGNVRLLQGVGEG